MDELEVTETIRIPLSEIDIKAVRSQGAGGQNVNKVATAIHLRFDIRNSPSLPDRVRTKLLGSGDQRISTDGPSGDGRSNTGLPTHLTHR